MCVDAHGDVLRGLQVVESACAVTSLLLGEKIEVSRDMDTETRRLPLGVCARWVSSAAFQAFMLTEIPIVSPRSISPRWYSSHTLTYQDY